MEMKWKRFVSIPVVCVFDLMGFVYFVTMFILMEEWLGLTAGYLHASLFTLLGFLSVFSFISCVLTDPGQVPSDYQPDVEQRQSSVQHSTVSVQHFRKCDKCRTYKPPRAHHCRVCKRCILRMDHHCLWINNCVGYWNYKSFVLLVLYATLACVYSSVIVISCALQKSLDFIGRTPFKIFYITYGALVVGLSITLGSLLGWHIFLITRNMTTIEHHESTRAMWLARKTGQTYRHPFNISLYRNVELILGPNMLKWLCPTSVSHLKDGTSYPATRDS